MFLSWAPLLSKHVLILTFHSLILSVINLCKITIRIKAKFAVVISPFSSQNFTCWDEVINSLSLQNHLPDPKTNYYLLILSLYQIFISLYFTSNDEGNRMSYPQPDYLNLTINSFSLSCKYLFHFKLQRTVSFWISIIFCCAILSVFFSKSTWYYSPFNHQNQKLCEILKHNEIHYKIIKKKRKIYLYLLNIPYLMCVWNFMILDFCI